MLNSYAARRLRLLPVLVLHVFMPIWFIGLLVRMSGQDSATWLIVLLAGAAHAAYVSIAGAWSWFGGYFQKSLPLILGVAAILTRPRFVVINDSPQAAELRLLCIALGAYFTVLTLFALFGWRSGGGGLELEFPLRSGRYMIAQGGRSRIINRHVRVRAQRYGLDIVKIGKHGVRASGLYPVSLKKYAIFGEQVRSPCQGVVLSAVDDLPDQVPAARDPRSPLGNHVAINREGTAVYLAHLMQGSVTVEQGQRVRVGQILGRVGNSGDSAEPHLHIHSERGGVGVRMRWGGRALVRNDVVELPG